MNTFKNSHIYSLGLMLAIGITLISLVTVGVNPHAQNSCDVQPADMAAWYPGDGNTNDILHGTSGTRQGNAGYAAGQVGQAFSFDGVNSSVSIGNPTSLQLQDLTIEAWVKRGSSTVATLDPISGGFGSIFAYGQNGYALFIGDDGHLSFHKAGVNYYLLSNGSGNFPDLKITDTNFHHVAVTKSGENVIFYLDGVMSRTQGFFVPFEFTTNANIGAYSDSIRFSFLGLIDELSIYKRVLNQSDIQAIFNAGAAGKCKATSMQFESAKYPSGSASGTVTARVVRTGDTSSTSSVNYATSDGTAKAGKNYTSTSGTLNFASGDQSKTITVPILNDPATTTDTNFQLALSNAAGTALGATSSATLNIFATTNGPGRLLSIPQDSFSSFLQAVNPDGTNSFQVTSYRYATHVDFPSVSRLTGVIAFNGCGEFLPTGTTCFEHGRRIYVMNSDGSGLRQVTTDAGLASPFNQNDDRSIISPDGTRIAFISGRPPATDAKPEVFVINTDGTGLHQITTHQNIQNLGESKAINVVWSPDSQKLLVHAMRLDNDANGNQTLNIGSLFTYNADGTGEALFRRGVSNGATTMALDWSPDGRSILYPLFGGPNGNTFGYVILDALNPDKSSYLGGAQLGAAGSDTNGYSISGVSGSVRFSPDGQKILYGDLTHRTLRTIDLDGTNITSAIALSDSDYFAKWWVPGAAIPQPHHLTLTPNAATVYGTQTAQVTPTLFDNNNNVIFHNADFGGTFTTGFLCNAHPCTIGNNALFETHITIGGLVYNNNNTANGVLTLCGENAGFNTCTLVAVNFESIGVSTTTPLIRKSGADGAGVFNFTRRLNPNSTASTSQLVPFVLSGAGINGTDYILTDAAGNQINGSVFTIPAGQNNFVIKVVPLITPSSGDKAVTLTIKTDDVNYNYVADGLNTSATVTIKDDHPQQTALSLSLITPNKGGDTGKVSVTIYGANINSGATVKLARNGQADITGTSVNVASNGTSLTATFDPQGKPQGAWSVVVTNPNNQSATLADAFTIEVGRGAEIWTDLIGRFSMRTGYDQQFFIALGNTGNSDAPATKLTVTLPKTLFEITSLPEYPVGAPAFLYDDGTTYTLQLFVYSVPVGSSIYIPFRLKPLLDHEGYEMSITATSSDTMQRFAHPADPNGSLTAAVIGQTGNSLNMNMHLADTSRSIDTSTQFTSTPATQAKELTLKATESNGIVTIVCEATIPRPVISSAPVSHGTNKSGVFHPQQPPPPVQDTVNIVSQLPGSISANGQVGTNYVSLANNVNSTINAAASVEDRYDINNYLFNVRVRSDTDGVVPLLRNPDVEVPDLNEAAGSGVVMNAVSTLASIPKSPVNAVIGAEISGVASVADGLWAKKIYGLYKANQDWYANPDWTGDGGLILTQDQLIALLHIRAHPATKVRRIRRRGTTLQSSDPNDKSGPLGSGTQHYITGTEPMSYLIQFENKPEATAAAQEVVVTDQLDASKVDFSTFQLGPVSFSDRVVAPPPGLSEWTTDVDLRPTNNLIVRVNAKLDKPTGLVTWRLQSIDPATGQPTTDPLAGFLPPDKNQPEGQGSVLFNVMPKTGLAVGTEIRNAARIIFDRNAPIDTPEWLNTIDNSAPTSHVVPLASNQSSVVFNVSWTGQDTGSGIQTYDVYFSENGGPFTLWSSDTSATSARFIGLPGKTYSFYSVAHDGAGNLEAAKTLSEASTSTTSSIVNSIDDPRYFVYRHYRDFLSRAPDQSGLDFWTNQITGCGNDTQCVEVKRINVSAAFFLSIEFQETGYLAYLTYKESYGNLPGAPVPMLLNELLADAQEIGNGVVVGQTGWEQVLESNKQAYMLEFVQRSRFTTAYPTAIPPAQLVDTLYLNAGVTPSASDRTDAINEFGVATTTDDSAARARVLRRVTGNAAFRQQEFNKAFVLMQYYGYLRRNPNDAPEPSLDYQGYNFWLNKLNQFGGNFVNAEMVKAFIVSGEYRQRFGP